MRIKIVIEVETDLNDMLKNRPFEDIKKVVLSEYEENKDDKPEDIVGISIERYRESKG